METNLLVALIGALGVFLAVAGLLYPIRRARKKDTAGLDGAERLAGKDEVDLPPLLDRLLGPVIRDAVAFLGRNPAKREDVERRLRRSGWRYKGVGDFYANKVMTAGLFFLGGAAFVAITGEAGLFFVPLLLGALGLYIPDYEVSAALKKRRQALYVEMAFTLDRLALLMEAGVAFQEALAELAAERGGGIFVAALRSAVAWIRLGTPVPESLRKMMDDLPEEAELEKFVSRAQKRGRKAEACRAQADLMRNRVESNLLAAGLRSTLVITTVGGAFILPALALLVVGPPIVMALSIFRF
jgi:Flp pilus assembly protein TadB